MNATSQNLLNNYQRLRSRYEAGQLSQQAFYAEIQKMQTQDEEGVWWAVEPGSGSLMRYQGNNWVPVQTAADFGESSGVPAQPSPQQPSSRRQKVMPFIGLILSASCGGIWALYTTLRVGQGEPVDCMTPIIMVLLPLGLWLLSKPIDQVLGPVFAVRDNFPKPILIGAAFALPFVLGVICSSFSTAGYGAMRWTAILSILGAYLLTRKRQVIS